MAQYSIGHAGPIAGATPVSDAAPLPVSANLPAGSTVAVTAEKTGGVIRPTVTISAAPDYSANDGWAASSR